jgi:hypothetical protein
MHFHIPTPSLLDDRYWCTYVEIRMELADLVLASPGSAVSPARSFSRTKGWARVGRRRSNLSTVTLLSSRNGYRIGVRTYTCMHGQGVKRSARLVKQPYNSVYGPVWFVPTSSLTKIG